MLAKNEEPKVEEISEKSYTLEELPKKKINGFLNWYATVLPSWNDTIKVEEEIKSMQKFIEKVAVWYELRYPNYAITGNKKEFMNDTISNLNMFEENFYIKELLGEDSIINDLDWSAFYILKHLLIIYSIKKKIIL